MAEANVFLWAIAVHDMAYEFIRTYEPKAPFSLPELTFVDAGIAIIHDPDTNAIQSSAIVEEDIDGEFVKYIGNGSAVPLEDLSAEDAKKALFLSFLQHVQYQKTGGLVYVSDYQGHGSLLTDPQIMTSEELKDRLFGDGNVTSAFSLFKTQHVCSQWCFWYALESLKEE
ncbi:MHCK/EF2 kinase [Mycena floridula]|nr:MHCK/EF2 kinase [Mycena floridula]KAJ7599658.1 MHCK/EF2 kinase [Mycena floridula]